MLREEWLGEFRILAEGGRDVAGGRTVSGAQVELFLRRQPARYLCHGWQSWSLSAWLPFSSPMPIPRPKVLHPLQTDPRYAMQRGHHGSFYGAVEFSDGKILFLGALGLESHVELRGDVLIGTYETGTGEWFVAVGEEASIFADYAQLLGERFGRGRIAKAPRVWCSWYSLYTRIREAQMRQILFETRDLPFDVFQIDDGWQRDIGDWEANEKFPSGMAQLADEIRREKKTAGLWLAPLLVVPSSSLYREHADWLLRDERGALVSAGVNWEQPLYALDTSLPEVTDWLAALMKKVRGWGYDYVKLDFLYAGALPGKRRQGLGREAAYRQGLSALRDALGEAYLLTCGAPILPSLGLCDGLRIGPDVAGHYEAALDRHLLRNFSTPGVRNALRTCLHRLWLRPLLHTDPDVAYFSRTKNALTDEQRRLLQDMAHIAAFKATSELPSSLLPGEREALRGFLSREAAVTRLGRTSFSVDGRGVDLSLSASLPPPPGPLASMIGAAIGELVSLPGALGLYMRLQRQVHEFRFSE